MRMIVGVFCLLLLSGCAGLSKEECLTANWQIIGFEDGADGRNASRIGDHRRDCAKHGISPDKAAYDAGYQQGIYQYCSLGRGNNAGAAGDSRLQQCPSDSDYHRGYEQGLVSFCTYNSGYDFGLAGGRYGRVCPPEAEADFLDGYVAGQAIFTLQGQLADVQHELDELRAERAQLEADQDAIKKDIVLDQSLNTEDRARLLLNINELRDQDDELEKRQLVLVGRIAELQAELKELGVEL